MAKSSGSEIATTGGTGLSKVPEVAETLFPALLPDSDIAEAIEANTQGRGFDLQALVKVKTPAGGSKTWVYRDSGNNEVETKAIEGIIVYYGQRGVLWNSEDIQKGRPPLLVSYDLRTAERVSEDLGDIDPAALEACRIGDRLYDWNKLPWNKDGSGRGGFGRRCKESRVMAILQEGEAFPVIVSAGPGSLKTVGPFVTRLEVPHYRARVALTLEKATSQGGIDYSQIIPRLTGKISKEAGANVRRIYTVPLMAVERQIETEE
jgi:hypothetical protein